jgi:pilus assembly protein Flp/PilA
MPESGEQSTKNWHPSCIHRVMPLLKTYLFAAEAVRRFLNEETGQDLVEYALVVALIALGATASMSSLATSFSTAFSSVGSKVSTYTT